MWTVGLHRNITVDKQLIKYKRSSGDEIANVNLFTVISHT